MRNGRLPCLDGWRAVAIGQVIGSHCVVVPGFPESLRSAFNWCFSGNLGVRLFFVISGFLITLLLLRERTRSAQNTISLRSFWIRRGLRILPVYFLFLVILLVVQVTTDFEIGVRQWIGCLTFTANYTGGTWLPGHLWSLAVEEQFYLLWPLIFIFRGNSYSTLFSLLAFVVCIACAGRVYGYFHPDSIAWGNSSLLTNLDSLAVGCTLAFTAFFHESNCRKLLAADRSRAVVLTGSLLLLVCPFIFGKLLLFGSLTVPFGPLSQAIGFGILMLSSVFNAECSWFRWLNWQWIAKLGALSYSLYIWQQIFCTPPDVFGVKPVWYLLFPGWVLAALLTACASYYLVELPFLRFKSRWRSC